MKKFYLLLITVMMMVLSSNAQVPNGQLDDIKEFSTKYTIPFVMPDGVKLFTDVYMPRVRDSLVVSMGNLNVLGSTLVTQPFTLIPLGAQVIFYPTLNGAPNPNPYQLPTVFTRTPYDKGDFDELGGIMPILGYNYMLQDMRGRYSSEGVYFPMMSDSWNKNAYHPEGHILDYLPATDPKFSNRHEDGYNSIKAIQDLDSTYISNLGRDDSAGVLIVRDSLLFRRWDSIAGSFFKNFTHTNTKINNGTIGMFGASALGNTQLQLALAHRCSDSLPSLKCLMPVVATTEHMISTGYNNGVFRDRIVTGWLKGQIFSGTDDDLMPFDNCATCRQNSIHTSNDYDLPKTIPINGIGKQFQNNKFEAANLSIDHFTAMRYNRRDGTLANAGFYPNSVGRPDMDGSIAFVNADGEAVDPATQLPLPDLTHSRYENQDIPVLQIQGWWDIFTEGSVNNLEYARKALAGKGAVQNMQKLIIGPWAHQTIAGRKSGDRIYPKNVTEVTRVDLSDFDINEVPINDIVKSDLVTWFRYNLNFQPGNVIGEPSFVIEESQRWQPLGELLGAPVEIRVPSSQFVVPFVDMVNFLGGHGDLDGLNIELRTLGQVIPLPAQKVPGSGAVLPSFGGGAALDSIPFRDFLNDVPNYRFYVAGPDSAADAIAGYPNSHLSGNYWVGSEKFPPDEHIQWKKMYMHQDGSFNYNPPIQDEGYKIYVSDPDDPILTVGGSNMIVRSPDGTRNSQSQMEMTDPTNAPFTMDREGVIQFNSDVIPDSITIMGMPVCTLYAKSNPGGVTSGPTDTDWDVRICDEWPDGRVYFVQEGIVNARGRDWARALVDQMGTEGAPTYVNGVEDPGDRDLPYSNINIGEVYEYVFKMMPIAYNWAAGHKIRVLINSTNYTRYQANPNLPLEDGEFFRRKPGDGQFYTFQGQQMFPRIAVQRVHFSPDHPTSINFPTYNKDFIYSSVEPITIDPKLEATIFPNPTTDKIQILVSKPGEHEVVITDISGRTITTAKFDDNVIFNVEDFSKGIYFATITDLNKKTDKITKRFVVQ